MSLSFKDKVVIVTGGGAGLGRSYALDFAQRGAKVVVNDLANPHEVVKEIKNSGGIAVADTNNVIDGGKIVETAVKAFGTVHVVINNAGILRDSSFKNMTEKNFRLVLDVHLNGAYAVSKAAWPIMRKQKYGRIINITSPAGLYGNFGQTNYSAAKSALVGLAETLAKEGYKYNISVNCVSPTARSKMTESLLPKDLLEKLSPDLITPIVVYLSHESLPKNETGKIFESAAGYYAQSRWERSPGELFYPDESFTAEAILNKIPQIFEFKDKPHGKVEHPIQPANYRYLSTEARKIKTPNDQGSKKVSLKDKVVLITGAGGGLGRAHAHFFAKYGAKVVVNDIVDPETVVQEIIQAGGEAHADKHNAATDAEEIIKNIINKYGKIDAIVNNAGILRDKSFVNMTDKMWKDVFEVHVMGTVKLCKAVWPIFSKQKYGRIINITSTSGIYGSFGQANYSAAKMAILGFSRTLAIEGKKSNITVNIVAPHAETAMTKTIFKAEDYNIFPPELVSPLLVLLASDQVPGEGLLFEIGGGWCGATRLQTAKGVVGHGKVTAEFIKDNWKDIVDFGPEATNHSTIAETTIHAIKRVVGASGADDDDEDEDDDEVAEKDELDSKGNPIFKYTERDVILYNIGVGAKANELDYVYENSSNFQVIPSFGTVISQNIKNYPLDFSKLMDNFSPVLLLHGEQYIKINRWPIPTSATVATSVYPVAIVDKGKATVLVVGSNTYDVNTGKSLFYNEMTTFNRGAKAKGGSKSFKARESLASKNFNKPSNQPDFVKEVETSKDQASIYRLSGDYNPLHIDPQFAKDAKFDRPILHGLGYLGVSVKALLEHYGPIKEIKVRFSGSVYPGDKLKISGWKNGDTVIFETYNLSSGNVVISSAAIKLFGSQKL